MDINCDMGESFWDRKVGSDEEIMPFISSANIACGFHGGDPVTIEKTINVAIKNQVSIGAHPSFYDLEGFGRNEMSLTKEELSAVLRYQISAVKGMVTALGGKLSHVKPHGALYNMVARSEMYSEVLVDTVHQIDPTLRLFGLPNSVTEQVARQKGLVFVPEAFADRAYNHDGTLVRRNESGAVIDSVEVVVSRVIELILNNRIKTIDNEWIALEAKTICIHGDGKNAIDLAKGLYKAFRKEGIDVKPNE